MREIHVVADNSQVTIILDRRCETPIAAVREAIKLLMKEVIKYEHGIDPDIDW